MIKHINRAKDIWHIHFTDEKHHYSEFEASDIEYFISVLLYNQFKFKRALETMQTMEIANDFLEESGDTFQEVQKELANISFEHDEDAIIFILDFINQSRENYSRSEQYLLNRIEKHIILLQERYSKNEEAKTVDFEALNGKMHPVLRAQKKV